MHSAPSTSRCRSEATSGVVIVRNARGANVFCYDTQAGSQDAIRAYNR